MKEGGGGRANLRARSSILALMASISFFVGDWIVKAGLEDASSTTGASSVASFAVRSMCMVGFFLSDSHFRKTKLKTDKQTDSENL